MKSTNHIAYLGLGFDKFFVVWGYTLHKTTEKYYENTI